jgi:hypothetical protein
MESAKTRRSALRGKNILSCRVKKVKTRKSRLRCHRNPRYVFRLNLRVAAERGSTCCRPGYGRVEIDDAEGSSLMSCGLAGTDCFPEMFDRSAIFGRELQQGRWRSPRKQHESQNFEKYQAMQHSVGRNTGIIKNAGEDVVLILCGTSICVYISHIFKLT